MSGHAHVAAESSSPEEHAKPDLKAIEGGGETTPKKTGHLRAVDSASNGGKTPFEKTVEKTKAGWGRINKLREETGKKALIATGKFDEFMQRTLRTEDPGDADPKSILLPPAAPLYAAGDMIDGTALNAGRRAWEITRDTGSTVRALYRTVTRPIPFIGHFTDTLFHPIKYLANPTRLVTSTAKLATNVALNAPTRILDELVNRGIKRPLQRFQNFPLLGKPLSIVGGAAGWLAKLPRRATEYVTRPIEIADAWVAHQQ